MDETVIERGVTPHERELTFEDSYEKIIRENFRVIAENAHPETGLFPAVDLSVDTPESKENHMQHAWIRDLSMNHIGVIETIDALKKINPESGLIQQMEEFVKTNLPKTINFLNQPRWLEAFNQNIFDYGDHTELSQGAPEVHLEQDGRYCPWDQNQPESWGEFLIAAGRAKESGIIPGYTLGQMEFLKAMTKYLIRIQPWKFKGAGMWEGLPAGPPSSRSNAIAIAKGLDAASSLFADDEIFKGKIDLTIVKAMRFVKDGIDTDYTMPEGHPDGADLAMLMAMALPGSQKNNLPFLQYLESNGSKLQIGPLPGAIRFVGDSYKKGELGEARWFMADPALAVLYSRAAEEQQVRGNEEKARDLGNIAQSKFQQALRISRQYGYCPELFVPQNPQNTHGDDILFMDDRGKEVELVPFRRSLLWNNALMMNATTQIAIASRKDMAVRSRRAA